MTGTTKKYYYIVCFTQPDSFYRRPEKNGEPLERINRTLTNNIATVWFHV